MTLSLMSFSFQRNVLARKMDADRLCKLAKANGIDSLDLMASEIRLYRVKKLKKALADNDISCGCVIETLPFYRGVEKFPQRLEISFALCDQLGVKSLMIVPGWGDEKACAALRERRVPQRPDTVFQ